MIMVILPLSAEWNCSKACDYEAIVFLRVSTLIGRILPLHEI